MVDLKVFSVTEYVGYVNNALAERDAVVEGEVSEYRVNQGKWVFFKIKDESSTLECFTMIFKVRFPLEDGMRVRLYGTPRIYAKTGKLSISVEWVEPTGEGSLKRAFELLKAELEKEGLFSQDRKRPLPTLPKRIGVITSRDAAAFGDFKKIIGQRFSGLELYLYHVQVQGADAISSIQEAFSFFNANHEKFGIQVVALIRGGGSLEDLAAFNSREVAFAVFGSAVPVICGVGHEEDVTIADYVADVRASTPSHAAELLVPHRRDVLQRIEYASSTMEEAVRSLLDERSRAIEKQVGVFDAVMAQNSSALSATEGKLRLHLKFFNEKIILGQSKIDASVRALSRYSEQAQVLFNQTESFLRLMRSFSPQAVLERGYAIMQKNGKTVSSVKDVSVKDVVQVRLKDGQVGAEIL